MLPDVRLPILLPTNTSSSAKTLWLNINRLIGDGYIKFLNTYKGYQENGRCDIIHSSHFNIVVCMKYCMPDSNNSQDDE